MAKIKFNTDLNTFKIDGDIKEISSIDYILDYIAIETPDNLQSKFPHKDSRVLHSDCIECNKFPHLKIKRFKERINFTGEYNLLLAPCPSEVD